MTSFERAVEGSDVFAAEAFNDEHDDVFLLGSRGYRFFQRIGKFRDSRSFQRFRTKLMNG